MENLGTPFAAGTLGHGEVFEHLDNVLPLPGSAPLHVDACFIAQHMPLTGT
jgi:hypothetical protein